jgi:hypothetical protein
MHKDIFSGHLFESSSCHLISMLFIQTYPLMSKMFIQYYYQKPSCCIHASFEMFIPEYYYPKPSCCIQAILPLLSFGIPAAYPFFSMHIQPDYPYVSFDTLLDVWSDFRIVLRILQRLHK